jgi:hypothetical protein
MILNINQLARLLQYSPQGTRKLLKRLQITLSPGNQQQFDTNQEHPLALSIRLLQENPGCQVLYSIRNLADLYQSSKGTVLNTLRRTDIVLRGTGRKKFLYLSDLISLEKQLHKK